MTMRINDVKRAIYMASENGTILKKDDTLSTSKLQQGLRHGEIVIPGWHDFMDDISDHKLIRRSGGLPFVQILLSAMDYPLEFVTGAKTFNFAHNVNGDYSLATIDSHAVLAACGFYDVGGSWRMGDPIFRHAETVYTEFAHGVGVQVAIGQALAWVGKKDAYANPVPYGIVKPSSGRLHVSTLGTSASNGYNMPVKLYHDNVDVKHLQRLYDAMPSDLIADGMKWYPYATEVAQFHADQLGIERMKFATIVAILSPGRDWGETDGEGNMKDARITADIMRDHGIL